MIFNVWSRCVFGATLLVTLLFFYLDVQNYPSYEEYTVNNCSKCIRRFNEVYVHLDLKGAPPRVSYIEQVFEVLRQHEVDGVLIEYEDMFPYRHLVERIPREDHYSEEDIRQINEAAHRNKLTVIPLIQTFGHLEFLLKNEQFVTLRENPLEANTICPSDSSSINVLKNMIEQIRKLHPNSTHIHIGSDEAYHIAEDERCVQKMEKRKIDKSRLKLEHIAKMGKVARNAGFESVFAWNDMFDKERESILLDVKLDERIVPVVWGYKDDVTRPGYFPDGLFKRIDHVFDSFFVASAFKGANGINQTFLNITRYVENHRSYNRLMDLHHDASKKCGGIFVTGWSRYSHGAPLCELLPLALPSLVTNLIYINNEYESEKSLWKRSQKALNCPNYKTIEEINFDEERLLECDFPGNEVFRIITGEWRQIIDRKRQQILPRAVVRRELEKNARQVIKKLRIALNAIFFDRDVEEICAQYLRHFNSIHNSIQ